VGGVGVAQHFIFTVTMPVVTRICHVVCHDQLMSRGVRAPAP
jgi:hypothetical protein